MKTFLFAIPLVLGAASISIGCDGGDDQPAGTAEFAGASDAELLRAVQAGLGGDLRTALFLGFLASNDLIGVCLTEEVDGDTVRFSGPCSDPDGRRFQGSMTLSNLIDTAEEAYDPEQVSRVEFAAFSFDVPGSDDLFEVDGWVEVDHLSTRRVAALRLAEAGVSATSDIELGCDQDQRCTPADGSMIDVAGVGTAIVTGTWVVPGEERAGSGVASISGADTLSVDLGQFAAGDDDGCIAIEIDGEDAGEVCETDR